MHGRKVICHVRVTFIVTFLRQNINITQSLNLINVRLLIYDFKEVGAQIFPRTDFFKLATQKGNDLFVPKKQKNGGHRLRFGENMPRRIL